MKYCIGCTHFYYDPGSAGYHYSSWTHDSGTVPSASCKRMHWSAELDEGFTQEKFQKAMEQAETCPDFEERAEPPQASEAGVAK